MSKNHSGHPLLGLHLNGPDRAAAASAAARSVVSRRFGLVTSYRLLPPEPGLPNLAVCVAKGSPRSTRKPFHKFSQPPLGTGISTEPDTARLAAIAEVVERYTLFVSQSSTEHRMRASYNEIARHAVAPADFALFSQVQYRRSPSLTRLTNDTTIDWCWAFSLTRNCATLIPEAVAYPSRPTHTSNNFVTEPNSTGVACDVVASHALLSALYEVLERDALAVAWHGRLPMTTLDPDRSAAADLISGPLTRCSHKFSLYQVPTDYPVPVVLAVAWHQNHVPHAATGAACRPNADEAARKALFEACQMLWHLRRRDLVPPETVRRFEDHATFFATRDGASMLHHYLDETAGSQPLKPPTTNGSATEDLSRLVNALADLGLEVLTVELTTSDVAAAGFRVFRIIVPGTIDIAADARYTRLGGRRLYELPVRLGVRDRPLDENELNLLPAPLA